MQFITVYIIFKINFILPYIFLIRHFCRVVVTFESQQILWLVFSFEHLILSISLSICEISKVKLRKERQQR